MGMYGRNHEGYADPTASAALYNVDRQRRGYQSRKAGELFESIIEASLDWYRNKGVAHVEKTPEPMKPLGKPNRKGQFLACYTKAGQNDFKGTLNGGRSVAFEAKHTEGERIDQSRVTKEQADGLEMHNNLGAAAFVLVSFGMEHFYRIPWNVWRDMKVLYGRKYIKRLEVEAYRVEYMAGVLKLLEGMNT